MKSTSPRRRSSLLALAGLVLLPATGLAQSPTSPLEKYRKLQFPPDKEASFDKGWHERVALEYEVVNDADLADLRAALKDRDPCVRAVAAHALGIRADKPSADALAELVKSDPSYMVRIRAVEALGYLKLNPEAIEAATKDATLGVQWVAKLTARQIKDDADHAATVRKAYAAGIQRADIASAKVGRPAPDFTAQTIDGKTFRLSAVLGKKPIAIYFAAFDG